MTEEKMKKKIPLEGIRRAVASPPVMLAAHPWAAGFAVMAGGAAYAMTFNILGIVLVWIPLHIAAMVLYVYDPDYPEILVASVRQLRTLGKRKRYGA